jgi:hypothetical protein
MSEPDSLGPGRDQALTQRATRERWPIPESVKRRLVQVAVDLVDPETESGAKAVNKPRLQLMALKTLQGFDRLSLDERRLEILESQHSGPPDSIDLDVIEQAKAIRERRRVTAE